VITNITITITMVNIITNTITLITITITPAIPSQPALLTSVTGKM
jgi:hypothetical protein